MPFFNDGAPKEVQKATIEANQAFRKWRHAVDQSRIWNGQAELLEKEWQAKSAAHIDILNRWNQTTNEVEKPKAEDFK